METRDRRTLAFGPFALDSKERRLTRRGRVVALTGKPLELLELLLRHAPALVRREDIRERLWKDRVVEYDAAINACIRDIRSALGDDPKRPRFVETVPRHGYRIIAGVNSAEEKPGGSRLRVAVAALAAVIAVATGAGQFLPDRELDPPLPPSAARQAFVKGQSLLDSHAPADAGQAVSLFERAVAFDPDYAEAWAGMADAHFFRPAPPGDAMPAADRAVRRALEIAPRLARAHRRLADLQFVWKRDFDRAEASYRTALDIDAGDAATHHAFAAFLIATGRERDAIAHMHRALAIDPLSTVLHGDLAWFYSLAGRYEDALEECRLLLELAPDNPRAIGCSLRPLIALGRLDEAARVATRLMSRDDLEEQAPTQRLETYWRWRRDLHRTGLAEGRFVDPMSMAVVQARLGDPVRTLHWIERARSERSRLFVYRHRLPELRAALEFAASTNSNRDRRSST